MLVQFNGAAGEVTGSSHLVHVAGRQVLLDCGMVQGGREENRRNTARFGFDVRKLDAVVLSHAHIDHCGRLPLLARRGYRGPIHAQRATAELLRIMLEDAARLAASDAETESRWRQRRGLKAIAPWFDLADVAHVMKQIVPLDYGERRTILPGIDVRLQDAGHIIGAASVELWGDEAGGTRKLVFSGDIGPRDAPLLRDPTPIQEADLVLMESTYGDRLHRSRDATVLEMGEMFRAVADSGGVILIPAFAVGRTQEILYWMARQYDAWQLGRFRIVLDSPMAAKVLQVYRHHEGLLDKGALRADGNGIRPFELPNLEIVTEVAESMALNRVHSGLVVIAGSGMCNGGRIKHHLRHHLWRPSTHVMIVGYQAQGTLGRRLVDREPVVRIFGEPIKVAAQVHTVGGLSAHADQAGLLEWYGHFHAHPPVCLVHGEEPARVALAALLREKHAAAVTLPVPGTSVEV